MQDTEQTRVAVAGERSDWIVPRIERIRAGEAENNLDGADEEGPFSQGFPVS